MKRTRRFLGFVVVAFCLIQGMRLTTHAQTVQSGQLVAASRAAKVQVHPEEFFSMTQGTETFSVAPVVGWQRTPATDLRKGVNIGYGYFSTAEPRIPRGYYTLRAYADVNDVGTIAARIQFIDRSGRVAAELPAQADIHSLTVPPGAASIRPTISTASGRVTEAMRPMLPGGRIIVCFCCSNGVCVCFVIFRAQNQAF